METLDNYKNEIARALAEAVLDEFNSCEGNLPGAYCPKCKNKGKIRTWVNGRGVVDVECECMKRRENEVRAQDSGLSGRLTKCTFGTFKHQTEWQHKIYDTAYKSQYGGNGFFIGGKPGCGKTHICIALVQSFLAKGVSCRYIAWGELITSLKQTMYHAADEYNDTLTALKNAPVLFIDDLFRTEVTNADRAVLFSLIDYRHKQVESGKQLVTIVSRERYLSELSAIDEAIGRRVEEITRGYAVNVPREDRYKYRN